MALSNGGIARRIYENADAALQLQVRTKEYARKNIYRLWFMSSLRIFPEIKSWVLVYLMILGREGSSLGASEGLYPNHDSSPPQITVWTNPETHTFLYLCKKDRLSRGSDDKKTSHLGSYSKPLEAPPLEAVCYGFPKTQQVVSGTYRQTGSAIPPAWIFPVRLERCYSFGDVLFFRKPIPPVLPGCAETGFASCQPQSRRRKIHPRDQSSLKKNQISKGLKQNSWLNGMGILLRYLNYYEKCSYDISSLIGEGVLNLGKKYGCFFS